MVDYKKIINAYENIFFYLPMDKYTHFFIRAYRITGNQKYRNILSYYFQINKIPILKKGIEKLEKREYISETDFSKNLDSIKSERKRFRHMLYIRRPEIPYFNEFLVAVFFLDQIGLKGKNADLLEKAKKLLKKVDFSKIYVDEDVIKYDSSFAVNSLVILEKIKICSVRGAALDMLKRMYIENDNKIKSGLKEYEFLSLIYSLTHIVIAESGFYQFFVIFENNVDEIIQRAKLDILAEVGLCFRLTKQERKRKVVFRKIMSGIKKKTERRQFFDRDLMIKKEHTNSILMMLYSPLEKFYKGPNIGELIK